MTTAPDPHRWKALALLCVASFMVILDASIVLVALPSMDAELGFAAGDLQWVMSGYALSFGGLLLLGGRSADLLGRRRMFLAGTALFGLASLLCGFAWDGTALIGARVLQGMSAAIMAPTALSILMTMFAEGGERNKALGVWSAVGGLGGSAGVLVGGPITSELGWEWIFFVNVPVAVALLALSPVLLRESRARMARRSFDVMGAATVTTALVLLVYAVVEAPRAGWGATSTLVLIAASAGLFALFAVVESRAAAPLVPLRVLRSRTLVGGNFALTAVGIGAFGSGYIVTLYVQGVLGYSPLEYGLASSVVPIMATVGSVAGQSLVTRRGFRAVAVGGLGLMAAGCLLLTQVSAGGTYLGDVFFGLLLFGPGLGAAFVAASVATLAGVAEGDSGLASGLNNAAFQIGGALGVAILSTVALSEGGSPVDGYRAAFGAAAALLAVGAVGALVLGGPRRRAADSAASTTMQTADPTHQMQMASSVNTST